MATAASGHLIGQTPFPPATTCTRSRALRATRWPATRGSENLFNNDPARKVEPTPEPRCASWAPVANHRNSPPTSPGQFFCLKAERNADDAEARGLTGKQARIIRRGHWRHRMRPTSTLGDVGRKDGVVCRRAAWLGLARQHSQAARDWVKDAGPRGESRREKARKGPRRNAPDHHRDAAGRAVSPETNGPLQPARMALRFAGTTRSFMWHRPDDKPRTCEQGRRGSPGNVGDVAGFGEMPCRCRRATAFAKAARRSRRRGCECVAAWAPWNGPRWCFWPSVSRAD